MKSNHMDIRKSPPELGGDTMRTLKFALRAVTAGLLLTSGVAAAAPADFVTDLGVTLAFVAKSATETTTNTIAYGGTRQVKATLTVPAGTAATGITVDATIPTGLKVTAVTNCTPTAAAVTAKAKFPCTVANLLDGASAALTITLSQALPSPLPTVCNQTATYTAFSVTVTTSSTDPVAANNTAAVTPVGVPLVFADVGVDFTGPATAAEGANVTYDVTVTNHGPCTSANVWAYSDAYGSAPFVSATWACANTGADFEVDGCQLGDIAAGASVAFTKTYNIPTMASDAISLYHPNGVSLGGPTGALVTKDYDHNVDANDNALYPNSSDMNTVVTQSVGCSSAGAGGPTGLLALGAVLALVRRRRRAE
jgi:MYXO-CTERM domain-containing protein